MSIGHGNADFIIRWMDYSPEKEQWVKYEDVTTSLIKDYLIDHGLYDHT